MSTTAAPARHGPGRLAVWRLAARRATLPAAVVPVLVGSAVASGAGRFHLAVLVAALLPAVLIQVGANLASDYFDFLMGADTDARLGPTRVTQSGLLPAASVRAGALAAFGLAAAVGL